MKPVVAQAVLCTCKFTPVNFHVFWSTYSTLLSCTFGTMFAVSERWAVFGLQARASACLPPLCIQPLGYCTLSDGPLISRSTEHPIAARTGQPRQNPPSPGAALCPLLLGQLCLPHTILGEAIADLIPLWPDLTKCPTQRCLTWISHVAPG